MYLYPRPKNGDKFLDKKQILHFAFSIKKYQIANLLLSGTGNLFKGSCVHAVKIRVVSQINQKSGMDIS